MAQRGGRVGRASFDMLRMAGRGWREGLQWWGWEMVDGYTTPLLSPIFEAMTAGGCGNDGCARTSV